MYKQKEKVCEKKREKKERFALKKILKGYRPNFALHEEKKADPKEKYTENRREKNKESENEKKEVRKRGTSVGQSKRKETDTCDIVNRCRFLRKSVANPFKSC